MQKEIEKFTVTFGDFNNPLITDITNREKISRDTKDFKSILNQLDLVNNYRNCPSKAEFTLLSSAYGASSETNPSLPRPADLQVTRRPRVCAAPPSVLWAGNTLPCFPRLAAQLASACLSKLLSHYLLCEAFLSYPRGIPFPAPPPPTWL